MAKAINYIENGVAKKAKKLWYIENGVAKKAKKAWYIEDGVAKLCYKLSEREWYNTTAIGFTIPSEYATSTPYDDVIVLKINKVDTAITRFYLNDELVATSTTSGEQEITLLSLTAANCAEIYDQNYVVKIVSDGAYGLVGSTEFYESTSGDTGRGTRKCTCVYAKKYQYYESYNESHLVYTLITYVEMDNNLTSISTNAFNNYIPTIGSDAPKYNRLALIRFANIVPSITDDGFTGLPNNVYDPGLQVHIVDITWWLDFTAVYGSIFAGISLNTSYYIDDELVTSLVVPHGVTSIPDSAFGGWVYLVDVSIPASVTSIGNYAFSSVYCYIRTVTFMHTASNSLTMGTYLFSNKNAYELTVNHYGNATVTGYDYATDNATVTFNQLG